MTTTTFSTIISHINFDVLIETIPNGYKPLITGGGPELGNWEIERAIKLHKKDTYSELWKLKKPIVSTIGNSID